MIKRFLHSQIARMEQRFSVPLEYAHHIAESSVSSFLALAKLSGFARYRRKLPVDAAAVAAIVASRHEDCGSCLQITVNEARRAGVSKELINHVLAWSPHRLPVCLNYVYKFTESIVEGVDEPELRESLRACFGEEGLIELSYAIATARMYPTIKRTLGFAKSCERIVVA